MVCLPAAHRGPLHSKGQPVNDVLSIASDVLTLIGATLSITLEARRARREARKGDADHKGENPPQ